MLYGHAPGAAGLRGSAPWVATATKLHKSRFGSFNTGWAPRKCNGADESLNRGIQIQGSNTSCFPSSLSPRYSCLGGRSSGSLGQTFPRPRRPTFFTLRPASLPRPEVAMLTRVLYRNLILGTSTTHALPRKTIT